MQEWFSWYRFHVKNVWGQEFGRLGNLAVMEQFQAWERSRKNGSIRDERNTRNLLCFFSSSRCKTGRCMALF